VAELKPLRLKAQRVAKKVAIATEDPVAQICVDTGVFHLPDTYDYLVPADLHELVIPGVFVKVPFGPNEVIGYVQDRKPSELDPAKLKTISEIISPIPLLTKELIEIVALTCERYACKPWDVIRSAIPSRVAASEKLYEGKLLPENAKPAGKLEHLVTISKSIDSFPILIRKTVQGLKSGQQLLVIVPDERDLKQLLLSNLGVEPVIISSDSSKSDRYENYLKIRFENSKLIVGNRSAIFTPLATNSIIMIYNDGDESLYERRFPSWNVRDIAMLRSGEFSLHFVGASPSLEIVRLVELGWIKKSKEVLSAQAAIIKKTIVHCSDSSVSDISLIKAGLKLGNVLVVMAETGYVNAIACQKCRNQARCECGGKIYLPSKGSELTCAICEKMQKDFLCDWCGGQTIRSISKGSSRFAEEIAKAVPGFRVLLSKGGSRIDSLPKSSENLLVVASYGCEPAGEYSAIVLKSLENLCNRVDLRSMETARRLIFENRSRLSFKDEAKLYLELASDNPIAQGVIRNDSYGLALSEMAERKALNLPPFCRIATLTGESSAILRLAQTLEDNDLFSAVAIQDNFREKLGNQNESKLILRSEISRSAEFSEFFRDLARYRGIKALTPLQLKVDPFVI
jgi:primosomal protein N' (replication factor Y) (superfamily II helicase)